MSVLASGDLTFSLQTVWVQQRPAFVNSLFHSVSLWLVAESETGYVAFLLARVPMSRLFL